LHEQPDGELFVRYARQQFEGIELRSPALVIARWSTPSLAGDTSRKIRSSAMFSPRASELISNPPRTRLPLILTLKVERFSLERSEVTK
jgi:hypothetical protein